MGIPTNKRYITPIMENHSEKNMKNEVGTGMTWWSIGFGVSI